MISWRSSAYVGDTGRPLGSSSALEGLSAVSMSENGAEDEGERQSTIAVDAHAAPHNRADATLEEASGSPAASTGAAHEEDSLASNSNNRRYVR